MRKRAVVYTLRFRRKLKSWGLLNSRKNEILSDENKTLALSKSRAHCREILQETGTPAQLRVFGRDGKMQFECTYGGARPAMIR